MERKKFGFAAVCAVSAMTLWLAGCSGQSSDEEKSSTGNSRSDRKAKSEDCLREKGAVVEAGESGGLGQIQPGELSQEQFQQAMKDCRAGGGKAGAGDPQKAREQMLAFAECMRKEGFDMADPEMVDGAVRLPRVEVPDDRRDAYEVAGKTCSQNLG
ncbi:hypothetical protein ABZY19_33805 [Streptomyces sp. NPDC006475]|uniref:hypothetical protein n=1 Tax=Streptomyces sp. NPDC006475 TaxID=3155719 RepID=UPI0033B9EFA3